MSERKKVLVAAAWPYAYGSLHLGHVAGLLGADVIARHARLCGHDVLFVSGSDCHGTPIALEAEKQKVHPRQIAEKYHEEFKGNLIEGLSFSYDNYTNTMTDNHYRIVQEIFLKLHGSGIIYAKTEEHPYCPSCKRFLPDRYVEGECPICHFDNARGDQCDECGNLLDPHQLLKARCKICGNAPERRSSEHFYLRLSAFQEQLERWVGRSEKWRVNAKNFTTGLLKERLHDRAITRDTEWGVPIPIPGYDGKSIYVWFEAVCGYLSASKEWAKIQGQDSLWEDFWLNESAIHYYVHGKDNIPFHSIVWPAILLGAENLHLPDRIVSSEYLTLEKRQFSRSRNWAVILKDFLQKFDADTLRYYLIANGPETADANFSWENYCTRTNSELIGIFGNYVHRVLSFVKTHFPDGVEIPNKLSDSQTELLKAAEDSFATIGAAIEDGRFRDGLRILTDLATHGNRYINNAAPWVSIKVDRSKTEVDLSVAVHLIRCLAILSSPFLPVTADKISCSIGLDKIDFQWQYPQLRRITVGELQPLYRKIERKEIDQEISSLGGGKC